MTNKQIAFIDEYMVDRNGAQAAKRAGYASKDANTRACHLLANPEVKAEIERRTARRHEENEALAREVCEEMQKLAFSEPKDAAGVAAKTKALDMLAKHLGMYETKVAVTGSLSTGKLDAIVRQLQEDIPDG